MAQRGFAQSFPQPAETLPGFKAENVLEARGIDNVSPFSGDPGVAIPIGPEYTLSTAFKWQLKAHYSAKFWNLTGLEPPICFADETVPYAFVLGDPTIGVGWSLQLGYVVYSQYDPTGPVIYFSPDGGRHGLEDGSHLRITPVGGLPNPNYYTVEFPDGTTEFFEQRFLPPRPVSGDSKDFTNLVAFELFFRPPAFRYGLTRVQDRFGKTVLKVNYDPNQPSQPTGIVLNPDQNGQGPTVVLHWSPSGGSISWWVVDSALFPAVGSLQRKVSFGYQLSDFPRNGYDLSGSPLNTLCYHSPPTVVAPLLQTVTYSDNNPASPSFTPFSYSFDYILGSPYNDNAVLRQITLPTGGTIQYGYGYTTGQICQRFLCDPEAPMSTGIDLPTPNFPPNIQPWRRFLDNSLAVESRIESDPATGLSATSTYTRQLILPCVQVECFEVDDSAIFRRVLVTGPGNDSGPGATQFATRSYFRVPAPDIQDPFTGIEVDRRSYPGGTDTGTPGRTLIRCYGHLHTKCGYHDGSGNLQHYNTGMEPPQAEVTWYGAVPAGSDGGTCSGTNPPCTASTNPTFDYNVTAGQYDTNVLTSTLPRIPNGWNRRTVTAWNPQTNPKWMLDIFSFKRVTDTSNPAPPAPSEVQTNFDFNLSNGFLNGTSVADGYSTLQDQFPQHDAAWDPTVEVETGSGSFLSGSFTTTRAFDVHGLALTSQRTGLGWKSFDVGRDLNTGLITASRDPNPSLGTSYAYDALGRLTGITPPAGEAPTAFSYDSVTQTTVSRSGSDGNATWQRYRYDDLGRLIREIRQMPSGYAARTHAYDSAGHATFVSEWGGCTGAAGDCLIVAPAGTTSSDFDPFGRPQIITRADGTQTFIDRTDGSINFSDSLESVTVNVNGNSSTTATRRDALGRVIVVTEPDVGQGPEETTYAYNALDKLATVTQGSQQRTFTYDSFGFLRSESTPEKGAVNYASYDALGDALIQTENDGTSIARSFDPAGRLCKLTGGGQVYGLNFYDGSRFCGPETDPNGGFSGGAFPNGKLTRRYGFNPVSIPALTVRDGFDYSDPSGRVAAQTTRFNSGSITDATQKWQYNSLGLVAQHQQHSTASDPPFFVATSYSQGLPTGLYVNGIPMVSGVAYQASGALSSYRTGVFANARTVTDIAPDPSGLPRPARISARPESTFLPLFDTGTYSYDGAGNITRMTGGTAADVFSYDARSRLTAANLAFSNPTQLVQDYHYDRYGNLTRKTGTNFCDPTFFPPQSPCTDNKLPTTSWLYDLRGNVTRNYGEVYTYDAIDRMISGPGWSYLFDAADERVVRASASPASWTYTLRDEAKRVSTEYVDGTWSRQDVSLGNLLVASYRNSLVNSSDPLWTFYSSDHLGTPRLVTSLTSGLVATPKYLPFGEEIQGLSGTTQRTRFASMERDTEASRYYDHARSHEFNLGRFLSPDTVQGHVEDPQSWNRYAYTRDNPLRLVDRNGRYEKDFHHDLTFILGLAAGLSEDVAGRVAGADQGLDDNSKTAATIWTGFQNLLGLPGGDALTLYHFTTPERRGEMLSEFGSTGSPEALGRYLHADQDSYAHAGFSAPFGHLFAGHAPDKTYSDIPKALVAAQSTFNTLVSVTPKLPGPSSPPVAWDSIAASVQAFAAARIPAEKAKTQFLLRRRIEEEQGRRARPTPL